MLCVICRAHPSAVVRSGEKLTLIDEVYKSEAATNTGNKTLSMLLAKYDRIYADPFPSVDVYTKQCSVGSAPPPPAPKPDVAMLIVVSQPAPPPVETAEAAPKTLPKTASDLPLIGLLGALLCSLSMMVIAIRTVASRFASPRG